MPEIYIDATAPWSNGVTLLAADTSFTDDNDGAGLTDLTTYYYRYRPVGDGIAAAYSAPISAATGLAPPTGVYIDSSGPRHITVNWDDSSDHESSYLVTLTEGTTETTYSASANATSHTFTVPRSDFYTAVVTTEHSSDSTSAGSGDPVEGQTLDEEPTITGHPTTVLNEGDKSSLLSLEFADNTAGEDRFVVEAKDAGADANFHFLAACDFSTYGNATTDPVTGLNTFYDTLHAEHATDFRILSVKDGEYSLASTHTGDVEPDYLYTSLSAPTGLAATVTTPYPYASVSWNAVGGAIGYAVDYRCTTGVPSARHWESFGTFDAATLSHDGYVGGTSQNDTYQFRVRALAGTSYTSPETLPGSVWSGATTAYFTPVSTPDATPTGVAATFDAPVTTGGVTTVTMHGTLTAAASQPSNAFEAYAVDGAGDDVSGNISDSITEDGTTPGLYHIDTTFFPEAAQQIQQVWVRNGTSAFATGSTDTPPPAAPENLVVGRTTTGWRATWEDHSSGEDQFEFFGTADSASSADSLPNADLDATSAAMDFASFGDWNQLAVQEIATESSSASATENAPVIENTLVIVISGHTQSGDGESSHGAAIGSSADAVANDFLAEGFNRTYAFSEDPGNYNPFTLALCGTNREYIYDLIEQQLAAAESLSSSHNVPIVLIGYSHGGGLAYLISQDLNSKTGHQTNYNIAFGGYIDAITQAAEDNGGVTGRARDPEANALVQRTGGPAISMMDVYQSKTQRIWNPLDVDQWVHGGPVAGAINEDLDAHGNDYNHLDLGSGTCVCVTKMMDAANDALGVKKV